MRNKKRELPQAELEYNKAYIEYLKHLTTLSTGSIVLMTAFLEKLFAKPLWKPAVVVSLVGFMISVLSSATTYTLIVEYEFDEDSEEQPMWSLLLGVLSIFLTWLGFLVGIISLSIFAIRNFL